MNEALVVMGVVAAVAGIAIVALQVPLIRAKHRQLADSKSLAGTAGSTESLDGKNLTSAGNSAGASSDLRQADEGSPSGKHDVRDSHGPVTESDTAAADSPYSPQRSGTGGPDKEADGKGWTVVVEVGRRRIPVTFPDGPPVLNTRGHNVIRRKPDPGGAPESAVPRYRATR